MFPRDSLLEEFDDGKSIVGMSSCFEMKKPKRHLTIPHNVVIIVQDCSFIVETTAGTPD